jgi:hypothetical protein
LASAAAPGEVVLSSPLGEHAVAATSTTAIIGRVRFERLRSFFTESVISGRRFPRLDE